MAKEKQSRRIKQAGLLIPIKDWSEADAMIKRIGDVINQITELEVKANQAIDNVKAELAEKVKPLQESIELHTNSLEAFAVNNQDDFAKARSKKLNFGLLGWRKSSSITIGKNTLDLIKTILKNKSVMFIRYKESIDKEALKRLTDEQLASVGARQVTKDMFFVEPDSVEAAKY